LIPLRRSRQNRIECPTLTEKDFQEALPKIEEKVEPANYFEGDGGREALW
jgi:hypothetical protein